MQQPLLALSIDLDGLDLYAGLFGLNAPLPARAQDAIPGLAAVRFGDLCATLGVKGTLFVVGRDVVAGRGRRELQQAIAEGHEIGNHSYTHDYALSRRTPAVIDDELGRADNALQELGARPVGFRAPGYTLSPVLIETVRRRGYRYDSSLMPSPPYYAAKVVVISGLALLGRSSRSIIGAPGQLFRPRGPHRDAAGMLELPISVLPGIRFPFYGSVLASLPEAAGRALAKTLAPEPLVVIELHGADMVDESDGIPAEIAARQRDMRIPASVKRTRIESVLRELLANRRGVTLAEAAGLWSDSAHA